MAKIDRELEKGIEDVLSRKLEEFGEEGAFQSGRAKEHDIYAPEEQKEFSSYKGSRKQYMREMAFREQASGSKSTFYNIAVALTGSKDIAKIISDKYDKKFSEEQQEQARKVLESEFGIEKAKKTDKGSAQKKISKRLNSIDAAVKGLIESVKSLSEQMDRIGDQISKLGNHFTNLTNLFAKSLTERGEGKFTRISSDLKPITVSGEGQEYLFYPDAPTGRQLYQKSKTGTAGRIASKKVQKKLSAELKRVREQASKAPFRKVDLMTALDVTNEEVLKQLKDILTSQETVRKKEIQDVLEQIAIAKAKESNSVQNLEADEMKDMLKSSLKEALEEIFRDNPELLRPEDSSFDYTDLLNTRGKRRPIRIPRMLRRIPGAGLAAGAAVAVTGAGLYALDKSMTAEGEKAKGAMDVLEEKYGLKTLRDERGNATGYQIGNQKFNSFDQLPQEYQDLISVYGPGDKRGGSYNSALLRIKQNPEKYRVLEKISSNAVIAPTNGTAPVGANIIEETKAVVSSQNDALYKKISDLLAKNMPQPQQPTRQIVNNNIIPVDKNKKIEFSNAENTYNRLLSQDLDHPISHVNFNMG